MLLVSQGFCFFGNSTGYGVVVCWRTCPSLLPSLALSPPPPPPRRMPWHVSCGPAAYQRGTQENLGPLPGVWHTRGPSNPHPILGATNSLVGKGSEMGGGGGGCGGVWGGGGVFWRLLAEVFGEPLLSWCSGTACGNLHLFG